MYIQVSLVSCAVSSKARYLIRVICVSANDHNDLTNFQVDHVEWTYKIIKKNYGPMMTTWD